MHICVRLATQRFVTFACHAFGNDFAITPALLFVLFNSCRYGQTGAGKTYTMDGSAADPGVNPRALKTLFAIKEQRAAQFDISVRCSMLEIYNEAINDLLDPENSQKLSVKIGRRGNHIPGLCHSMRHMIAHYANQL